MCGICGIVPLNEGATFDRSLILKMRDAIMHRGPDDAGLYQNGIVGFGSRRLSIVDLSERGHMPMKSDDGRFWITHNGEVYNYRELRAALESKGHTFQSNTDTEVLLKLYSEYGPSMLDRCNGMFAFAIWDSKEHVFFAARDRLGVKPFFYALHNETLYFSSEQKSLFNAGVSAGFDESTLKELLFFRYVAGERTPYVGVKRLLPGHYMVVRDGKISTHRWWSLKEKIQPKQEPADMTQLTSRFEELINDSVALRRISDVPVGILLSGGLDSSTLASVIAAQGGERVSSFTVRFDESAYDEGPLAKEVAEKSGLDYHELFVPMNDIPHLIEEATRFLDEPLVHGHDMQLLAISRYAKPRVTVLLSGEGADEVFGGYVRHRLFVYPNWSRQLLKFGGNVFAMKGRLGKASQILNFPSINEQVMFSSAEVFPSELNLPYSTNDLRYRCELIDEAISAYKEPVRQVMYYEQMTYLQSLMDRNDRMTMGASIECREPFLDYRMVEWAANIPTTSFFKNGIGKNIIRQAMANKLPESILRHKKWGFGAPWNKYLREIPALRKWVENLPNEQVMQSSPLSKQFIQNSVTQYLAGDNRLTPLIRQLVFTSVWHHVCVLGESKIFG